MLIGPIAAATSRLRVGSGGVMLPHYSPLKVAETFSMLRRPLSRADRPRARPRAGHRPADRATRSSATAASARPTTSREQLAELLAYLNDTLPADHPFARLAAMLPGRPERPEPWLLGSSPQSAIWAAELGPALRLRRLHQPGRAPRSPRATASEFTAVRGAPEPRVIGRRWALCAETDEEARAAGRQPPDDVPLLHEGRLIPVPPVETALRFLDEQGARRLPPATRRRDRRRARDGARRARGAGAEYGAEEVMIVTITHDHAARRRSYELIAEAFGLRP